MEQIDKILEKGWTCILIYEPDGTITCRIRNKSGEDIGFARGNRELDFHNLEKAFNLALLYEKRVKENKDINQKELFNEQ